MSIYFGKKKRTYQKQKWKKSLNKLTLNLLTNNNTDCTLDEKIEEVLQSCCRNQSIIEKNPLNSEQQKHFFKQICCVSAYIIPSLWNGINFSRINAPIEPISSPLHISASLCFFSNNNTTFRGMWDIFTFNDFWKSSTETKTGNEKNYLNVLKVTTQTSWQYQVIFLRCLGHAVSVFKVSKSS